jgi:hypothetical protein
MNIPQNNETWSHGLIRTFSLGRGQHVEVDPNQAMELIVCKLRDADAPLDATNLNPQAVLKPGSNYYRMPLIGVKDYCAIAINMAPQTSEFKLVLRTNQAVEGHVIVRITYHVIDSLTVLQRKDVLAELRMEAQRIAQHSVGGYTHEQVTHRQVEADLERLNVQFLGLRIQRVIMPYPIEWPKELMQNLREVINIQSSGRREQEQDKVTIANQRHRNDLIMGELYRLGIVHPEVVMYVLANYEKHNSNVMQAVQAAHIEQRNMTKEQRQQAVEELKLMIANDLVDRTQLVPYIEENLRNVTYGHHLPPQSSLPQIMPPQGNQYVPYQQQLPHQPPQPTLPQGESHTLLGSSRPLATTGEVGCQKPSEGYLTIRGSTSWFQLCSDETLIGRRERSNHIVISDASVSRDHCRITRRMAGHFVIANTKSDIVTLVNGQSINNNEQQLQNGNIIQIGPIEFTFSIDANQPTTSYTARSDEDETRLG